MSLLKKHLHIFSIKFLQCQEHTSPFYFDLDFALLNSLDISTIATKISEACTMF